MLDFIILIGVVVFIILIMKMRINIKTPVSHKNDHDNELQELNDIREFPMKGTIKANSNDYIVL